MVVASATLDDVSVNLLRAASDLLRTQGSTALTVRRIATEAGVSTMAVYSRFGGKDGVVDQLYVQGFERLSQAMNDVDSTSDPLHDLMLCGIAYRAFALANPTLYDIMFDRVVPDFEPSSPALVIASGTLELLANRVRRVIDSGQLRPVEPLHTAAALWATCHGVVSLEMKQVGPPTISWDAVFEQVNSTFVRGLLL